ncbi:hypothetical protein QE443_000056 [Pantoea ananatis]|nr:hypothetical protein [Pantoea ananatis]MDR6092651.1 hypothetical protein [Pantoea ananatis]PWV59232.1 DDE family transposase [Pantoea ananatis]PWV83348.1 DDE family transposase [Pantoea ananatis]REC88729.1 DDE family transposase [Pantoea ananatis]
MNKSTFDELKDQSTHFLKCVGSPLGKQKLRVTNLYAYNKALINRGAVTFCLVDEAVRAWYESATPSSRGSPRRYSDLAITAVLVMKRVFRLPLWSVQGFMDYFFTLMSVPDYSCVSKRAKVG